MMGHSPKPPDALMKAIGASLQPVRPAPVPHRIVLQMTPLALLVLLLILLIIGVRQDTDVLGPMLSWGASSAELALAILLVWVAAHESTAGDKLPRTIVYAAAAAATIVAIALPLLTFMKLSAIDEIGDSTLMMDAFCFAGSTVAGGILIVFFSLLFRKSLATRPVVAGTLYGAAAGIAVNAGWRMACPGSSIMHGLVAHGSAIIPTMLLGALIGFFLRARPLRPN